MATRERVTTGLESIGFSVLPSSANFIFVSHESAAAEDIKAYLETKAIFVRHFKQPRISNYLRITIGTDEQMAALISALKSFLSRS